MQKAFFTHLIIISTYLFYYIFLDHLIAPDIEIPWWDRVIYYLSGIAVSYCTFLLILPRYLKNKKYISTVVYSLLLFVPYAGVQYLLDYVLKPYLSPEEIYRSFESVYFFSIHFSLFIQYYLYGLAYWLAKDAIRNEREKRLIAEQQRRIEEDILRAELATLKAQINPHFLFNILSYFYTKSYRISEELSDGILKLSEILRYALRDTGERQVTLEEEVHNLKNFIAIHQKLFNNELCIEFNLSGDFNNKRILPLVLISFVENAFKHGQLTNSLDPLQIQLSAAQNHTHFYIKNKIGKTRKELSNGVGLNNIRRRLELAYKDNHKLCTIQEGQYYVCNLTIYDN